MKRFFNLASFVALCWAAFQIYVVYGVVDLTVAVPIHVMFAVVLTFILKPLAPDAVGAWRIGWRASDYLLGLCAIGVALYFIANVERISTRVPGVDPLTNGDFFIGILTIALVVEATRRMLGKGLTIVILVFLVYQFTGASLRGMPVLGIIAHDGQPSRQFLSDFLDLQILQNQGVFGIPSVVSYTEVFYFLLFGAFLEFFGGGQLFVDFATLLVGRYRGGMAKVAVISSTLFGAVSGSATANASVMGTFTIPAMRRAGMPAEEAAAVEAAASTGGQIMPPVMGAAAFLIAQFVGKPYRDIAIAGLIPALLFYASLFFVIDATARKRNYEGLKPSETTATWGRLLRELYLFIPVVLLVYQMFAGRALSSATLEAMAATVALSFVTKVIKGLREHGVRHVPLVAFETLRDTLRALDSGSRGALTVAIPCAGAGIIVGVATMSNLGLTFGTFVISLSGGLLVPALLLVMLMVIVMGMGMPTTAAYIMGAVLAIPALQQFDVPPLAAHFFVLYFAVLSMVTPPVALAAFVAAGIAQADVWKTGWLAFRNSLAGFLVAFAVVASPSLLLQGPLWVTLLSTVTALLGGYALATSTVGYLRTHNTWLESGVLFLAAVLLIAPFVLASAVGLLLLLGTWWWQKWRTRPEHASQLVQP